MFSLLKRSSGGRLAIVSMRGQTWNALLVLNSLTPSVWKANTISSGFRRSPRARRRRWVGCLVQLDNDLLVAGVVCIAA